MTNTNGAKVANFTPRAVVSMNRAYAKACGVLKAMGAEREVRMEVGEHIIFLARSGEISARKMCDLALENSLSHGRPARRGA